METMFLKLVNMSITASWLVLAVIILRLLLKKAPKFLRPVMWSLVGIRLILPFSFESILSLIPSTEVLPNDIIYGPDFNVNTGINFVDSGVNEYLNDRYFEGVTVPADNGLNITRAAVLIWLLGIAAMIFYTVISYIRIHKRVSISAPLTDNIFICDEIATPFILGVILPKIYLPSGLDDGDIKYVTAHEKAHLSRRDHWWKPLGFLLLTVYWFNPVVWLAYVLFCRDIELACDERVIKEMGTENKKPYSQALINCSAPKRIIAACPLAFGETDVKKRIKSVLSYKKPAFWIIALAVIICAVTAVCFLSDPKTNTAPNYGVVGTANGSDTDKAYMTLLSEDFNSDSPYVKAELVNNSDEKLCYGEEFSLYRDGKQLVPKEGYGWDSVLYKINKGDKKEITCYLSGFDLSSPAKYLLEKKIYFESKPEQEYTVYIAFFVSEQYYIANKQYNGIKSVFNSPIASEFYGDDNIPQFKVLGNDMRLVTNENTAQSQWTDIGQLQEFEITKENFDELLDSSGWISGYSAKKLRKNNKTAFNIIDGVNNIRYYVLEQKNGDIYICKGDLSNICHIFKMAEVTESTQSNSVNNSSEEISSTVENVNVSFKATVLEVYEKTVLVEPFEGEKVRESSNKISVSKNVNSDNPVPELKVGDKIHVVYDGYMLDTYPTMIKNVFAIYRLTDSASTESSAMPSRNAEMLVSSDITSVQRFYRDNPTNEFMTTAIYTDVIAEKLKEYLNTYYCEERNEGSWVKFNPAKPNNYALAVELQNGNTFLINIHFSPEYASTYYIATAEIKESFDITKDYSDLSYKRYVISEEFGSFLKSLLQ